jgi:hypothetical protein
MHRFPRNEVGGGDIREADGKGHPVKLKGLLGRNPDLVWRPA